MKRKFFLTSQIMGDRLNFDMEEPKKKSAKAAPKTEKTEVEAKASESTKSSGKPKTCKLIREW